MNTRNRTQTVTALAALMTLVAVSASAQRTVKRPGAVYVMTNEFDGNHIIGYSRNEDGTLSFLGDFPTGGDGASFDGGEGLDPLISAYSLVTAANNRFLLAVNAGSNTITAFSINPDRSLTARSQRTTDGIGPNSIANFRRLVYVSNVDADGQFTGEPDQEGSLTGFQLNRRGQLVSIPGSTRLLGNRPSAIQFSPDGRYLVVASINAGSAALASGSADELVVYRVLPDGQLSDQPVSAGASTLPFNAEGRNLPSAIGFEIVESGGSHYVVVTEAREFRSDGTPPVFDQLQTGSVSTWLLATDGELIPIQLDVLAGDDFFDGQRTACWIEFSVDRSYFWVSNALDASLSAYSFDAGQISLLDEAAAVGTPAADVDPFGTTDGWIDLWRSEDGRYLYQLFGLDGTIGVFEISGSQLNLIQEVTGDLPEENTQGIVAF